MAVNDAYLVAPWADVLYFADARWWEWHTKGLMKMWPWVKYEAEQVAQAFASFAGQKVTIFSTGLMVSDPRVYMLRNLAPDGLSLDPSALCSGSNSGYQAVNLSVLAGAKRVVLLGYDMRFHGRRTHSHDGHPVPSREEPYARYARVFNTMVPALQKLGVDVVNCALDSAITCFRKEPIESALPHPQ